MKKIVWLAGCLALHGWSPVLCFAQNVEGQIVASQYGEFQLQGTATNSFVFSPAACQVAAGDTNFAAVTRGVPVRVVDPGNHALDETVTAGLVNINACSVQLAVSNTHVPPFYVTSGTAGLQEAINANSKNIANTIILSADWYRLGGSSAIIASVIGTTSLGLVDVTTTPFTWYAWDGSAYAKVSVGGGGNPSGTTGAVQFNNAGSFGGASITGLVKGNGINAPSTAIPGTDYQTPIANLCSGGITCPLVGSTYSFNYSGSAGSGNVGAGTQYKNSYYPNAGLATSVGSTSNEATLPVGLSTAQINSVLSGRNLGVTLQPGANPVPFANTNHNPIHDDNTVVPAQPWNMRASGATCDAQVITGSITTTNDITTLTSGTIFTSASADGATWVETSGFDPSTGEQIRYDALITGYVSSTSVTLSAAPPFTITGASLIFGHQDNAAIADAIGIGISTGRQIDAPAGTCWTSIPQRFGANIVGQGSVAGGFNQAEEGTVFLGSAGEDVFQALDPSVAGFSAFPANLNTHNYTIMLNPTVDATKAWEICTNGTCVQQTPLYRPIGILGPDAQDPLAPQWIEGPTTTPYRNGATNGVATMTNSSAVACVPSSETLPAVGQQIVFPYQAVGTSMFETTVSSLSGAGCAGGTSPMTLAATWSPSTPSAPVEWFSGVSFQNIQTAIPASTARTAAITAWSITSNVATFTASNSYSAGQIVTLSGFPTSTFFNNQQITILSTGLSGSQFEANFTHANGSNTESGSASIFPFALSLANPIIPSPAGVAGVGPFGYVQIDAEQCAYYGNSNYPANAAAASAITLQGCAQNGTTAVSHSVGAIIVPLNPFKPSWPWPVTPTITSGTQTPANAEFFPAQGVGNAAISFPVVNGADYSGSAGMPEGHVHDILINIGGGSALVNSTGFQVQNDTAAMYFAIQPFGSTIRDISINNTFYGIVEGTPSTNTSGYFTNGFPTADGNHWENIFDQSSALPMDIISEGSGMFTGLTFFSQSFAPPNNYIPGFIPGTDAGSQGNLMLDSPFDDQVNGYPYPNTGVQFTTFNFKYLEPETGFFNQTQPLDYWNCLYCTWINTTPKGSGVRFIAGQFQQFYGGTLNINATTPIVLLGSHIDFEHVIGMGAAPGTTYGSNAVLNWGPNNTAYGPGDNAAGTPTGPNVPQLSGGIAPVLGQTDDTLATGNVSIPYVAKGLGYFGPEQMPPTNLDPAPMTGPWIFDPTSPISNAYVTCAGPSGYSCTPTHMTGNYVPIGLNQRIVAGPYYGHVSFKTPTGAASFTFRLFAAGNGACSGGTVYSTTISSPDAGWHDYPISLADFTGDSGCVFTPNITNGSVAFDVQLGYLDLVPLPKSMMLPITTPSEGAACNLPGSFVGSDANYIYVCASGGTVKRVGIS